MIHNAVVIGSTIYAMLCIKLDVSYTLSIMSVYQYNLDGVHYR
jgi:hypothetical protein